MVQRRGTPVPPCRRTVVPRNASAGVERHADVEHPHRIAERRGATIPFHRLRLVLPDPLAGVVHDPEIAGSLRVAAHRRSTERLVGFGHPAVAEVEKPGGDPGGRLGACRHAKTGHQQDTDQHPPFHE